MNTPDDEIEMLLGRLAPAAPDAALLARLEAAEPAPRASNIIPLSDRGRLWRRGALAAAAAIALTAALAMHGLRSADRLAVNDNNPPATQPAAPAKVPVESRQHLMEVKDLGVVQQDGQQPVRLIRATWLDEILYEPEPGGAPVKEAQVRQEVLPVALNIY